MVKFDFVKNPVQVKFIPTLISLVIGVVCWALNGSFWSFVPPAGLAAWSALVSDMKLPKLFFWAFILTSAAFFSYGIACAIYRAWAAAGLSLLFGSFPLSILFTHATEE